MVMNWHIGLPGYVGRVAYNKDGRQICLGTSDTSALDGLGGKEIFRVWAGSQLYNKILGQ